MIDGNCAFPVKDTNSWNCGLLFIFLQLQYCPVVKISFLWKAKSWEQRNDLWKNFWKGKNSCEYIYFLSIFWLFRKLFCWRIKVDPLFCNISRAESSTFFNDGLWRNKPTRKTRLRGRLTSHVGALSQHIVWWVLMVDLYPTHPPSIQEWPVGCIY